MRPSRPDRTAHPPLPRPHPSVITVLAVVALAATTGCPSRIPLGSDLPRPPDEIRARGRAIVERAVAAHGGRQAWESLGDVRFRIQDTWSWLGLLGAPPYPVSDPRIELTYHYGLDKGRIDFLDVPDTAWGHDSVEGWIQEGGVRTYDDVEHATFLVPTLGYFYGLPFKLLDDGARIVDTGPEKLDGVEHDTVLVTFARGVGAVQDRYQVYFDRASGRLAYVTFTVFEQTSVGEGDARYVDWVELDGVLLPRRIEIGAIRPLSAAIHGLDTENLWRLDGFDRSLYEKPD